MRNVRRILALLVLFSLFVGAMLGVLEAASRAGPLAMPIPSVIDASPPDETAKLVFVHASVGEQWLGHWLGGQQGGAYWSISLGGNNYNVRDYNIHNNDTLHDIVR